MTHHQEKLKSAHLHHWLWLPGYGMQEPRFLGSPQDGGGEESKVYPLKSAEGRCPQKDRLEVMPGVWRASTMSSVGPPFLRDHNSPETG